MPKCQYIEKSHTHTRNFAYLHFVWVNQTERANEKAKLGEEQDPLRVANIRRMRRFAAAGCQCDFVNVIRRNDEDAKHISYFISPNRFTVVFVGQFSSSKRAHNARWMLQLPDYIYIRICIFEFRAQNAEHK